MSRLFATVKKGKVEIQSLDSGRVLGTFDPYDRKGLGDLFKRWEIDSIACSSSVDFPETEGLPGVDVAQCIRDALPDKSHVKKLHPRSVVIGLIMERLKGSAYGPNSEKACEVQRALTRHFTHYQLVCLNDLLANAGK